MYRAKIVLGGTNFATKIVPPGKSVPGSEKGPLAILDVGLSVPLCLICAIHSLLKSKLDHLKLQLYIVGACK